MTWPGLVRDELGGAGQIENASIVLEGIRDGLLGTMNDVGFMAKFVDAKRTEPESPQKLMRFLARTPILPLDGARPIDLTRALFTH